MYGTRETIGVADSSQDQDVEKLAEAHLLGQALEAEGVNPDSLDAGTLLKVAYNLFGENSALIKAAMEGEEGGGEAPAAPEKEEDEDEDDEGEGAEAPSEPSKEAGVETFEQKFASADFLGRAMAHAFVQEQDAIVKEAFSLAGAKKGVTSALEAVRAAPGKATSALSGAVKEKLKAMHGSYLWGGRHGRSALGRAAGGAKEVITKHPKTLAAAAGIPTAAAITGVAAAKKKKDKKKEGSAFDALAEERALEILKEAGVRFEEPQATEEEKLAAAVEQRAWELLKQEGFLSE